MLSRFLSYLSAAALIAVAPGMVWAQEVTPSLLGDIVPPLNALGQVARPANAVPVIRVDKPRFADTETVRFWVGVEKTGDYGHPIPKEFWDTCRLLVTRPDSVVKTYVESWPLDGPIGSGWMGGDGLREPPMPGKYTLVYEFAGKRSAPATLVVERVPIVRKVQASFVFGTPTDSETMVTFTVHNGSDQTIYFPHRDGSNASVWLLLNGIDKPLGVATGYPRELLLDADEPKEPDCSFDNFTWDLRERFATILLKPGKTYRQRLPLNAAIEVLRGRMDIPGGQYEVRFGTVLEVLIGKPDGKYGTLSPVRLTVETNATCLIAEPVPPAQR